LENSFQSAYIVHVLFPYNYYTIKPHLREHALVTLILQEAALEVPKIPELPM
jgi:hypothetical protein